MVFKTRPGFEEEEERRRKQLEEEMRRQQNILFSAVLNCDSLVDIDIDIDIYYVCSNVLHSVTINDLLYSH